MKAGNMKKYQIVFNLKKQVSPSTNAYQIDYLLKHFQQNVHSQPFLSGSR
jgi:hypothetical protein